MDSQKANMYIGAIIGSLLFFLLLGFFSELIFVGRGDSGDEQLAFAIEIEAEAPEAGHEEAGTDWAAMVAAADLADGEKLFGKCKACHKIEDGVNSVGPTLWGVVGRDIAWASGYNYSDALASLDGKWDLETLSAFLESPKSFASGTKMSFGGMKKAQDRVNLIAYLNEADGSPVELASVAPAESTGAATEAAEEAPAADAGAGDFGALLAGADAEAGAKVFNKCKACHKVEEGKNGVGPSLWGVVGSDIGSVGGFKYSDAMKGAEGNWTGASLSAFLENPKGFMPGNKMPFPGLKDAQDRIDVIVYLNEADGSPVELASAAPAETAEAVTEAVTEAVSEAVEAAEAATETVTETATETVVAATEAAEDAVEEAPAADAGAGDFGALLADADIDVEAGKKVFRKCRACHKVEEGKNGVGPSLWGVVGSDIGSVGGFKYSDAMKGAEGNWTGASLSAYLENPKAFMPGNKMAFPGLKDVQDRINVIIFLNEVDGSPEPLQ